MRVAIIGAGASGMLLGGLLSRDDRFEVHCFEQADRPLRKLSATGNGRCNFTNVHMGSPHYTGACADFVAPLVDRASDVSIRLFERLGIPSVTLESGMAYPMTMMAETVVQKLIDLNAAGGVKLHLATKIVDLRKREGRFILTGQAAEGREVSFGTFDAVVLSSGGAYGIGKQERSNGYGLAKALGHTVTSLHPGIVALRTADAGNWREIVGYRRLMRIRVLSEEDRLFGSYEGDVIFTDYGLSGIAVLKASNAALDLHRAGRRAFLELDCLPATALNALESQFFAVREAFPTWRVEQALSGWFPPGLFRLLAESVSINPDRRIGELSRGTLNRLAQHSKTWRVEVIGPKKNDHGQITCGGIATSQIDAKTLASKLVSGLYFTGEILDVQGECGGYNLHWAWVSAAAVRRALVEQVGQRHEEDSCIV